MPVHVCPVCSFVTTLTEFNQLQEYASIRIHKINEDTGAGVYKWGLKKGQSVRLGLHTTVFKAELYAKKCMHNGEYRKGVQR
jgi:hypothetical protein